ncbi:hypothetical protein [Rhizorhabdus dicambivorans]|uniref:Uncharacterized protein n=1 Tax=Rhizorhabdus dicambivorans TaxID=1850238 RepID=A0A2A4FWX5_9SPHN|nr:hypothetical protein [Rhizorhabdus dicambivorans]ATE66914.1 hypothetical protein CMV14_22935 [Rhizorhabdus dicambivorans]PCE42216.1 hypothetical protein COO09_11355 [Rhizorhabdus dicambivorans]
MGLEALCICRVDDETAEAKALLESREMILRAPFRRSFPIASIRDVRVEGEGLHFNAGDSAVALMLGEAAAAKWAKKILTPAPSLAGKLGIGHASLAHVTGAVTDAALAEALDGHSGPAEAAKLSVAIVGNAAELDAALAEHALLPQGSHIWVIHGKGTKAAFGDNAVRTHMRALGYRDSKSSAVSEAFSATRYSLG